LTGASFSISSKRKNEMRFLNSAKSMNYTYFDVSQLCLWPLAEGILDFDVIDDHHVFPSSSLENTHSGN